MNKNIQIEINIKRSFNTLGGTIWYTEKAKKEHYPEIIKYLEAKVKKKNDV